MEVNPSLISVCYLIQWELNKIILPISKICTTVIFKKWLQRTRKEVGSKHCIFQSVKWNTFLKEAEINLSVKMELPSFYVTGMFLKSYIHK